MGCINENVANEIRRSGDILKKRMVLCWSCLGSLNH